MNKKNITIGTLTLVSVLVIAGFMLKGEETTSPSPVKTVKIEKKEQKIETKKTQVKPIAKKVVSNTVKILEKNETLEVVQEEILRVDDCFTPLTIEEAEKTFKTKDGVEPASTFSYKTGTIRSLKVGDTLVMPEVDNEIYELVVKKKRTTKSGNVMINAQLEGDEQDNKKIFVLSEGKKMAFIAMSVNGKSYDGEIYNGVGYFYRSADTMNAWVNTSKSDVIMPPRR